MATGDKVLIEHKATMCPEARLEFPKRRALALGELGWIEMQWATATALLALMGMPCWESNPVKTAQMVQKTMSPHQRYKYPYLGGMFGFSWPPHNFFQDLRAFCCTTSYPDTAWLNTIVHLQTILSNVKYQCYNILLVPSAYVIGVTTVS